MDKPVSRRKRKLKDRPIYFVFRKMVDPVTGEYAGCLVPDGWANSAILRERKYRTNDLLRASITHPRNAKFHRMVHHLGTLVVKNVECFAHLDSHAAIKRLQRESGVACETQSIDASPVVSAILAAAESLLGESAAKMLNAVLPEIKTIDVLVPQSISYDCMDESDFRMLWDGICAHIVATYWPGLSIDQIEAMTELMPRGEGD